MGSRFRLFCEMIDGTPAESILTIAETERQMLEKDISTGRAETEVDTVSILSFCRFLHVASGRGVVFPVLLPVDHLSFYRNTVERLIEAVELPFFAKERFDEMFYES